MPVVRGDELYFSATAAKWYSLGTGNDVSEGNHTVIGIDPIDSHTREIFFADNGNLVVGDNETVWVSQFGGGI